jgi:hypothetical protein
MSKSDVAGPASPGGCVLVLISGDSVVDCAKETSRLMITPIAYPVFIIPPVICI